MSSIGPDSYESKSYRRYVLGLLVVAYAFNFIDRYILIILQESVKTEFMLSDTQLGLLTGFAFAFFYSICSVPIARLADSGTRRTIISIAVSAWSLMTVLSGLVTNFAQLVAARIGVAVGEAGASPPAHSMISDIFPRDSRATALAIYSLGINFGIIFGYPLGGWINEEFGWRAAFIALGLPGLLIGLLIRTTVAEPRRGSAEGLQTISKSPPIWEAFKQLWALKTFRFLTLAAAIQSTAAYGIDAWVPPYFIRTFQMGTAELGLWLGLMGGILGALGTFGGGWFCDRLGKRDIRWYVWGPLIVLLIALPAIVAIFLVSNVYVAIVLYGVPNFMLVFYLGPCIAISHGLVPQRMRALTSAIFFLVINFLGLGFGPLIFGLASDLLQPTLGADSLRVGIIGGAILLTTIAAIFYVAASRNIHSEYQIADSSTTG